MDRTVVPRLCKICDWLLNSSRGHFSLRQGRIVRVIVEFEVSKRHVLRPMLSIDMVQWVLQWEKQKRCSSRKRQGPMTKRCCYNRFFNEVFLWGKRRWGQEKTREWLDLIFSFSFSPKTTFLGAYIKKFSTFTFWCMVIPLGPHLVYT